MKPLNEARVFVMTGARKLAPNDSGRVVEGIVQVLGICTGLNIFRFGGARGADTVALDAVVRMLISRQVQQHARLEIVVPSRLIDQPAEAQYSVKSARTRLTGLADVTVIELNEPKYNNQRYQLRNIAMLEGQAKYDLVGGPADVLASFWHGRQPSGTYNTILAAAHRRVCNINFPIEGLAEDT